MNIALWYGSSYIDFAAYPIMVMITNVIEPNQGPDYAPGSTVQLMCSVDGPFSTVVLMWITPTEDVILYDPLTSGLTTYLTLYFDPIRTRDKGTYICMASVSSPAVSSALNSSALYTVDVQLSKDLLQ